MTDDKKGKNTVIPNSFQTPNAHVDEVMFFLSGDEYKVLNFATRHIMGWQDSISHRQNAISLSVFEKGFVTKSGRVFGGCGLSRPKIIAALEELQAFGLMEKVGKPTPKGQVWRLAETIDWKLLTQRQEEKKAADKARMKKVREAKAVNDINQQVVNDIDQQPVNDIDQGQLMGLTSDGKSHLLNQTHETNPTNPNSETQSEKRDSAVVETLKGDALSAAVAFAFKTWQFGFGSIPAHPKDIEMIKGFAEDFAPEQIEHAIREAVEYNVARPVPYVDAVLKRMADDKDKARAHKYDAMIDQMRAEGKSNEDIWDVVTEAQGRDEEEEMEI